MYVLVAGLGSNDGGVGLERGTTQEPLHAEGITGFIRHICLPWMSQVTIQYELHLFRLLDFLISCLQC